MRQTVSRIALAVVASDIAAAEENAISTETPKSLFVHSGNCYFHELHRNSGDTRLELKENRDQPVKVWNVWKDTVLSAGWRIVIGQLPDGRWIPLAIECEV